MNNLMNKTIHVLVPAAGSGQRFGGPVPKQYLKLNGKTVIERSLERLLEAMQQLDVNKSDQIVVAISDDDDYWQELDIARDSRVKTVSGGSSRAQSVQNVLNSLANVDSEDWILIHDAVRPLIALEDIKKLVISLSEEQELVAGGLLATPIYDTVKRANADAEVIKTEDRNGLWVAQTPQMFRYHELVQALEKATKGSMARAEDTDLAKITDEASAMEAAGFKVKLVNGSRTNIKITRPEDLEFAELILGKKRSTEKNAQDS